MSSILSIASGIGTKNTAGKWLEVYYPAPIYQANPELLEKMLEVIPQYKGGNQTIELDNPTCHALEDFFKLSGLAGQMLVMSAIEKSNKPKVMTILTEDIKPESVPIAYLKLHLISHRLVKPHEINLDGIFSVLPNVAWTNEGAIDPDEIQLRQIIARTSGNPLTIYGVDKFPKLTDYVIPTGVRIADSSRIRLGAYLGEGTTVMHEGFVNFNAGTLGASMVEGRISAGVVIKDGTDLGGGASIMGTLSGGNDILISLGNECLIGANAGVGIPLGDRCIVEAGLYVTAGTVVARLNEQHEIVEYIKAAELSFASDLLFRRNSKTGQVECLSNTKTVVLNEELHTNQ